VRRLIEVLFKIYGDRFVSRGPATDVTKTERIWRFLAHPKIQFRRSVVIMAKSTT